MKILLINPPALSEKPHLALLQPLGIASLAACLRKDSHQVSIVDALALGYNRAVSLTIRGRRLFRVGLDYQQVAELVPPHTELVGITAPFTHYSYIVRPLISAIRKQHKNLKIMLGGVYSSTLPVQAAKTGADYIVIGEGEPVITSFVNGEPIENIDGLYEAKHLASLDNEEIADYRVGMVENLDALPFPARDLLPFDFYIKSGSSGRGKGKFGVSIHTSRGCPYNCSFCSVHLVFKRGYRARSAENVWQEMRGIIERYNVSHFEFEDDNLTLIKQRCLDLFGKMADWNHSNEQQITFITPNGVRIDTLDQEILLLMKRAGCKKISLGMEHGDQEMLRLMNKKLNLDKVEEVVYLCKKIGITMTIFLIVGFPGETVERWKKGIEFAKKLKKIDKDIRFYLNIAQALPRTDLLNLCLAQGYLVGPNPNKEEMVLLGRFANIATQDFSIKDIKKRMQKSERLLNNHTIFRRAVSKAKRLLNQL